MSAVLARIRTQYHDELPVQVGRNLELTPLARQLLPQVQLALPMIERSLVLRERNLTRADEAAGVTQSAISNSLNKLASCSMTPLLVRTARHFELTPRAQEILPLVREAMQQVDRTLNVYPIFEASEFSALPPSGWSSTDTRSTRRRL